MYSVMLAAMLTTTSATPEWGCHGCSCYSCYNVNAFTCGCSYGCSCYGCWGCHGCCGGCWGCYGSCWGCGGGCYCGGGYYLATCYGCYGCSGWYGCCGGGSGTVAAAAPAGSAEALEAEVRRLREEVQRLRGGGKPPVMNPGIPPRKPQEVSAPARVVVKLPADARLWVDDVTCPLTSTTRSFDTPALQPGQEYYYTVRAEVTRGGRAVSDSKRVILRAGEESVVVFGDMQTVQTAGR
jgi:uncharacterized protein (TIGR03000 family)